MSSTVTHLFRPLSALLFLLLFASAISTKCPAPASASYPDYINAGNAAFSKKSFAVAEACYARACASDPTQPLALSNRALAVMNQGRNEEAMKLFRSALKVDGKSAETYHAMGSLLHAMGDSPGAIAAMRTATALNPLLAKAYEHLGGLLVHSNDISAAAAAYERATALLPTDATVRISYARLLCALGRSAECDDEFSRAKSAAVKAKGKKAAGVVYVEHAMSLKRAGNTARAEELLLKAIAKDGQLAAAYYTLGDIYSGDIYTENKRIPQAMQAHETATRINPNYAEAYMSLAMLYWGQGALQEAERLLKHSIRSQPLAEAAANLGIVQSDLGKTQDALAAFRQAQQLNPNLAEAYKCMGDTYKGLNQWSQAIEQYNAALRVRPSYSEALNDLVHALQQTCDWEQWVAAFKQVERALAQELAAGALPLFVKPFHALVYPLKPEHMLLVARAYAARAVRLTKSLQPQPLPIWLLLPRAGHLRLGYVSSNIGDHSLTHLMRSVFRFHGSRLQVHVFALNPSDGSGYRKDLEEALGARFHSCSEISGVACARLVNRQRIHTLCDLVGYTGGGEKANEVFAVRPAAHAWSYMGFCASSGAAYMDGLAADAVVAPPEAQRHFSEKLMILPPSYFVTDHRQSFLSVLKPQAGVTRESLGLPAAATVYACFNQLYKIDPKTFNAWTRLLQMKPESVLWLLRFPAEAVENIKAAARSRGLSESRIVFSDPTHKDAYMQRAKLADLFIDTPLVNAHTSATDVLWAGVPMVTLPRSAMISRVAASILIANGLPHLIARNLEDYISMAAAFTRGVAGGADGSQGGGVAGRVRAAAESARKKSGLFDTHLWTRRLDSLLMLTWDVAALGLAGKFHVVLASE